MKCFNKFIKNKTKNFLKNFYISLILLFNKYKRLVKKN